MSGVSLGADWARVASFVASVDAGLGKWLEDTYRVGLTDYRALALIAAVPEKELRINDLAIQVGLNQSSVTRLVGRLQAKELVRRDVCPADGRGVYAVITELGQALVADIDKAYVNRLGDLLADPQPGRRSGGELRHAWRAVASLIPK
jgi:DNA-binding MarR family transcriptional regulator